VGEAGDHLFLYLISRLLFSLAFLIFAQIQEAAVKTTVLRFLIIFLLVSTVFAQPPDSLWTRSFRHNLNFSTQAFAVCSTSDEGFLVVGRAECLGADSILAIRLTAAGETAWTRTYGYSAGATARAVIQTHDGGFALAGSARPSGDSLARAFVVRIDDAGLLLWSRAFTSTMRDTAFAIVETPDGNFVLTGKAYRWSSLTRTLFIRVSPEGDSLSYNIYEDGNGTTVGRAIVGSDDGGFAMVGFSDTVGIETPWRPFLVFTDSVGNRLTSHVYDLPAGAYAMLRTADQGYVFTGYISAGENWGMSMEFLIRLDRQANTLWTRFYALGNDYSTTKAYALLPAPGGGFVTVGRWWDEGTTYFDVYLMRTDDNGDTLWTDRIQRQYESTTALGACLTADGGYVVVGYRMLFGEPSSAYVVRLAPDPLWAGEWVPAATPQRVALSAFPNPFNPTTNISITLPHTSKARLTVYDITGREVQMLHEGVLEAGAHHFTFDGAGLPSGIYFARVESGGVVKTQKLLLLK
jgi:hypothetical protein